MDPPPPRGRSFSERRFQVKKKPAFILASASPRRSSLLRQLGVPFTAVPADVDERVRAGETPEQYAGRLSRDKARAAADTAGNGIVIAADTIVVLDDEILGKPVDEQDALRMLSMLSGRIHRVITALTVMDTAAGKTLTRLSQTIVRFRRLSAEEIASYVKTGEPLDKAGAYGIQDKGALLVSGIEGCYFNVVGLPISLLGEMLKEFGLKLL
jgi:septum formation protein